MYVFKKIVFIYFFILISVYATENPGTIRYKWSKVRLSSKSVVSFVTGKSNDYFLQNLSGKLFHIKDNSVVEEIFPPNYPAKFSQYLKIGTNKFIYATTTFNWKGEIYLFDNGEWRKLFKTINIPIHGVYRFRNDIYFYGDFGLLLKSTEDFKITEINTKITSHILGLIEFKNKLYLSTRNDGILSYDGKRFTKIQMPDNFIFSRFPKIVGDTLYFFNIRKKLFKLAGEKIVETNNKTVRNLFQKSPGKNFGFAVQYIYVNKKIIKAEFPQYFSVLNTHAFEDYSVLLFTRNNSVYFGKTTDKISFVDLAKYYKVADLPNSENIGVFFFDANNDGIDDLLLINRNEGNYLSLYKGVKNSAYADITSITNLPFTEYLIENAAVGDVDNNGKTDIILQTVENGGRKILIYLNDGDFHFNLFKKYDMPGDFYDLGVKSLTLTDYDNDGDNDIILMSYYGPDNSRGYAAVLLNNFWGVFNKIDYSLKNITRHWNNQIAFVDLNNDNLNDIFNVVEWTKDRIYINRNGKFVDETDERLPEENIVGKTYAMFSDFDNDADLDIFLTGDSFLKVFENRENGRFTEISKKLFDKKFFTDKVLSVGNLKIADFNNDGFEDFFLSVKYTDSSKTFFFLNRDGKKFTVSDVFSDNENVSFYNGAIADFDNDFDMDIYEASNKQNILWINTLNRKNAVKISLNAELSAPGAYGGKIWLYKHGHMNEREFLLGYKQIGAESPGRNFSNSSVIHFGLGENKNCDVKVRFPSGKVRYFKNVKAGSLLRVNEIPSFVAVFYNAPAFIYRFLRDKKNQLYILLILLAHIIMYYGLRFGFGKLRWSLQLTYVLSVLNMAIFWLSLYLSSFASVMLTRYLAPLAVAAFVTVFPLFLSYIFQKNEKKNVTSVNEKLLKLIMSFSHGEWALRNLNSILLLCENAPSDWKENEQFTEKLNKRLKTFTEMTVVSVKEIIELETIVGRNKKEIALIEKSLSSVLRQTENLDELQSLTLISEDFVNIRAAIRKIRDDVYARFSSDPIKTINSVAENYEQSLLENGIALTKIKKYPQNIPVLIKAFELGNIIDNLFQNSLRFLKNSPDKLIEIELIKESPKIVIKFTNTGEPIPEENWEKIFEQGFSGSGSTGQGLYQSRKILQKYGGRIYVFESDKNKTVFKIELNEGKSNK